MGRNSRYNGITERFRKRFTQNNHDASRRSNSNFPVIHNLQTRDQGFIDWIMDRITVSQPLLSTTILNSSSVRVEATNFYIPATFVMPNRLQDRNVTHIARDFFQESINITNVTLPNTLIRIYDRMFYNISNLSTIAFAPNSQLQTIGERAFYGTNINSTFRIPDSVHTVGANAFANTPLYINSATAVIRAGNWVVGLHTNSPSTTHHF